MNFFCPQCGTMVAAADVDLGKQLAKCQRCQNIFSFAQVAEQEQHAKRAPAWTAAASDQTVLLPRPPRMQIEEWAGTWTVTWRWFTPVYIFLAFFCTFWDGFLLVWYFGALSFSSHGGISLAFALFPLIHVAVGIGLTYLTLCGFVNRTRLSLDSSTLTIKHGPLPWKGVELPRSQLKQLYCKQKISRGDNSTSITYDLMAMLTNGEEMKLVGGMSNSTETRFLEQQLERRMGIVNQPVDGEYRP